MNLHHLDIFHAVAESGSITRAAEKLGTAQPAISRQLAALEKSLGARLVDRLPRGIRLTPAGEVLASYARRIFSLDHEAERAIAELSGLQRGSLLIGASLTTGSYLLPPLLAAFHQQYPQIQLTLQIANTEETQRRLARGELDLGFTEGFVTSEELTSHVFAHDELVPIVPPNHPVLALARRTARAFCKFPLILREPGSGTREVVERALRRAGVSATPAFSLGSIEAIKAAVGAGMGVAFVSRLAITPELKAGLLATFLLDDLRIERDLHHLTPRHRTPSHAATAFLAMLHRLPPVPPSGKGTRRLRHGRPGGVQGD